VTSSKDDHVNLGDFGWANLMNKDMRETFCGTLDYLPPEIILGTGHSESADMWNMGILLHEMTTGQAPFTSTTPEETCRLILQCRLSFAEGLDEDAIHLLISLCRKYPKDRLGAKAALEHLFITKCLGRSPAGAVAGENNEDDDDMGRPSVMARRLREERQKISADLQRLLEAKKQTEDTLMSITTELEQTDAEAQKEQKLREQVEANNAALAKTNQEREKELQESRKRVQQMEAEVSRLRRGPRWPMGLGRKSVGAA